MRESTLASGHFKRLRTEFDFFGHFPGLFAKLAPVTSPNASQRRAQEINAGVIKDGPSPCLHHRHRPRRHWPPMRNRRTGEARGSAVALHLRRATAKPIGRWPRCLRRPTTATPANGWSSVTALGLQERHPAGPRSGSASSSLPGIMGPTLLLGQRAIAMRCGIARISLAAGTDVVAGSRLRSVRSRVTSGDTKAPLLSGIPHNIHVEMKDLETTGTEHEGPQLVCRNTRRQRTSSLLEPEQFRARHEQATNGPRSKRPGSGTSGLRTSKQILRLGQRPCHPERNEDISSSCHEHGSYAPGRDGPIDRPILRRALQAMPSLPARFKASFRSLTSPA